MLINQYPLNKIKFSTVFYHLRDYGIDVAEYIVKVTWD